MAKSDGLKMENRPSGPVNSRGREGLLRLEQWNHIQDLARQGLSVSAIERETGFNWKTVKRYLGQPPPAAARRASARPQLLDPFRDRIRARLAKYPQLTARRLYEEVQEAGYAGKETQVRDFVRSIRPAPAVRAVWRFETPPGEQAQVDWANVGYVIRDGQRRKASAFW